MTSVRQFARLPRFVGVALVVVALAAASYGCGANIDRGKILFGPDKPTTGGNCQVSNAVTSITSGTSVYATYIFKAKPASEVISLEITKDGASFFPKFELPVASSQGLDCFGDTTDLKTLSNWTPGLYHFSMTSSAGVVAEGDLTVK